MQKFMCSWNLESTDFSSFELKLGLHMCRWRMIEIQVEWPARPPPLTYTGYYMGGFRDRTNPSHFEKKNLRTWHTKIWTTKKTIWIVHVYLFSPTGVCLDVYNVTKPSFLLKILSHTPFLLSSIPLWKKVVLLGR